MRNPVPSRIRTEGAATPSPEVERAKTLYLQSLRRRVRDGSYLTGRRVDTALQRLLQAVRDDLPDETGDAPAGEA